MDSCLFKKYICIVLRPASVERRKVQQPHALSPRYFVMIHHPYALHNHWVPTNSCLNFMWGVHFCEPAIMFQIGSGCKKQTGLGTV